MSPFFFKDGSWGKIRRALGAHLKNPYPRVDVMAGKEKLATVDLITYFTESFSFTVSPDKLKALRRVTSRRGDLGLGERSERYMAWLEKWSAENPDDLPVLFQLAERYMAKKDFPKAAEVLERALPKAPAKEFDLLKPKRGVWPRRMVMQYLAHIYNGLGDQDRALKTFQAALKDSEAALKDRPKDAFVLRLDALITRQLIVQAYHRQGKHAEALKKAKESRVFLAGMKADTDELKRVKERQKEMLDELVKVLQERAKKPQPK